MSDIFGIYGASVMRSYLYNYCRTYSFDTMSAQSLMIFRAQPVTVENYATVDLCTHLSSELNTLRASRPPFVIAMQQCSGGTICSASCIIFGISSIEDGCFECSKFHVDINFRYLGFRS